MAMNKYMHPRNIYKSPPNFKELALEYPEFRAFIKQELGGKVTLDFKDLNSLRALSCTLLKKDFGLMVDIPVNKLIPTIPLRLNYILWLEDILKTIGRHENVIGIDIGTGASCVYPLLAAKKNKWSMICTEKDLESFTCARNNIENNNLQDLIEIIQVKEDKLLEGVIDEHKDYDFCMCNPPFFSSSQELHPFFKSRKSSRPHPKNAFCATINEVVSKGGEVEFISKLIHESKNINKKIKIFSTMIGHKCSLPPLKKLLRDVNVTSFNESCFCQGNTTRWGLSWTFCETYDLRKVPDPIKQIFKSSKRKDPIIYHIPVTTVDKYTLNIISEKLLQLCKELDMVTEEVTRNSQILRYFVTAFSNTWSHQRRKRREKNKVHSLTSNECKINDLNQNCSPRIKDDDDGNNMEANVKSPGKRLHTETLDGDYLKKLKISTETNDISAAFLKFTMALKMEAGNMYLELNCTEENDNREYLHQILQYIKNNLKLAENQLV